MWLAAESMMWGDGDVCEDCDAGVSQAVDSDVWSQAVGVAVPVRGLYLVRRFKVRRYYMIYR